VGAIVTNEERETMLELIEELEDAVSFMETLEEYEDEEGKQRRERKIKLIKDARLVAGLRQCSECGDGMNEGYCIEGGLAYYCTDECLEKNMTREDFLNLYDDGEGDSYYTEWEE
jgi:hypothetical protein